MHFCLGPVPFERKWLLLPEGVALSQLHTLKRYANAFMFVPNIEVRVERLHASTSQRLEIVHHHLPAYVSITLRKHEIINCHVAHGEDLSNSCAEVYKKLAVVDRLGLQFHPCFAPHRRDGNADRPQKHILDHSVPFSLVGKVVYRCDLPTQYRDLSLVDAFPSRRRSWW